CEKLCYEADRLLDASRTKEETGDLDAAILMCNSAASKARAAMDAPYNNPQTITFARMKHNVCIMRMRSLQRRAVSRQESLNSHGSSASDDQDSNKNADIGLEGRHSRQGSRDSTRSRSSVSHSRQSSKDSKDSIKASHSRQNSKDGLVEPKSSQKSIEIYATLPKKHGKKKAEAALEALEKSEKEAAEQLKKSKSKEKDKDKDKKKEESKKKEEKKEETPKEDKKKLQRTPSGPTSPEPPGKDAEKPPKKQHKIRRKLLMGGLIRRKNRSMPDLREGQDGNPAESPAFDDAGSVKSLSRPSTPSSEKSNGYLSEGNSEYSNPNLERSRLMRKSYHGSAKGLQAAKVPPPVPARTSSKLTIRPRSNSHGRIERSLRVVDGFGNLNDSFCSQNSEPNGRPRESDSELEGRPELPPRGYSPVSRGRPGRPDRDDIVQSVQPHSVQQSTNPSPFPRPLPPSHRAGSEAPLM
ncbi:unnamed protein product, partial [Darwinula stevensoni]